MFSKEEWLTHAEWLFMLFLFPFVATISPGRSTLLALLIVPFLLRAYQKKPVIPPTPFNLPLFGLLFMVLVSLWVTYDVAFSLRKMSVLVWTICLFWSLQNGLQLQRLNKLWLSVFICGVGVFVSAVALFNPVIGLKLPGGRLLVDGLSAIPGSASLAKINPNEVGGILAWSTPISFGFLLAAVSGAKVPSSVKKSVNPLIFSLATLAVLPMFVVLLLTASRTAIAGTLIACAVMVWLISGRQVRRGLVALSALAGIAILTDVFVLASDPLTAPLLSLIESVSGKSAEGTSGLGTVSGRVEIWSRALYGIQDFPFTGMGMNTFRDVVHILYPLFTIPPNVDIAHAHNQFMQTALDLGLPGLIFFASIWLISAVLLKQCWRESEYKHNREDRFLLAGVAGALLAGFIYGITDTITLGALPNFILWLLFSLVSVFHFEMRSRIVTN